MTDLANLTADWLAVYVRKTRNFSPLANWLNSDGPISAALRVTLADIVGGSLKPSGKRKMRTDGELPGALKAELAFWKSELLLHAGNLTEKAKGGALAFSLAEVEAVLEKAGIEVFPETHGECGEASRAIVGWLHGLSAYEIDKVKRKKATVVLSG